MLSHSIITNTNNNIDITDDKIYQFFTIISDKVLDVKCVTCTSEILRTKKIIQSNIGLAIKDDTQLPHILIIILILQIIIYIDSIEFF